MKQFTILTIRTAVVCVLFGFGAASAGADSHASDTVRPVQLSLFSPVQIFAESSSITGMRLSLIYGKNANLKGLDFGVVSEASGNLVGLALGFGSVVRGDTLGWQLTAFNSTQGRMNGPQTGVWNYQGAGNAYQFGVVNTAERVTGFQLGLFNSAKEIRGVQLGALNIIEKNGWWYVLPLVNGSF